MGQLWPGAAFSWHAGLCRFAGGEVIFIWLDKCNGMVIFYVIFISSSSFLNHYICDT